MLIAWSTDKPGSWPNVCGYCWCVLTDGMLLPVPVHAGWGLQRRFTAEREQLQQQYQDDLQQAADTGRWKQDQVGCFSCVLIVFWLVQIQKKEERRKVFFFFNLFLFCLVSIGQADQSSIHCKKLTNGVYFLAVTVKSFKLSMMVTPRAFLCIAASYGLSFAWVQCWVPASHFVTYSVTRSCA